MLLAELAFQNSEVTMHQALASCWLTTPTLFPTMGLSCRYGMAYVLHRLPAVANIIMTQEYLDFAQQLMTSLDRANKQAEMDVSPALGDMLIEM